MAKDKTKEMKKYLFIVFSIVASLNNSIAQSYFPDKNWDNTSLPKSSQTKIDTAISFAIKNEVSVEKDIRIALLKSYAREPDYKIIGPTKHRGNPSGMIVHKGKIISQWGDIDRVDMCFSVTKSFLSTIAGLAVGDSMIKLDDYVGKYVWDGSFDTPHNAKVTWKHLLQQNSDWSGTHFGLYDWADRPPKEGNTENWIARKLIEPGSQFEYNDVRVNLLSYSLLQVLRQPLPQVLKDRIMDKIGASSTWRWYGYENTFTNLDGTMMQSVSGGGHHGGGLFINAVDMAKFGYLFLRDGKWKDQQLISKDWIKEATTPSSTEPSYGMLWWLNQNGEWPGVSKSTFHADGYGGNFIVVDKENDLVVVARWINPDKMGDFMKKIVEGLK